MEPTADILERWMLTEVGYTASQEPRELNRALATAISIAIERTAMELRPDSSGHAAEIVIAVSEAFSEPVSNMPSIPSKSMLESLKELITRQLTSLGSAGQEKSTIERLGISAAALADRLFINLVQEISVEGATGGPLAQLANLLHQDAINEQIHDKVQLSAEMFVGGQGSAGGISGAPIISDISGGVQVVGILTHASSAEIRGTGILVGPNLVLTAAHVVPAMEEKAQYLLRPPSEQHWVPAKLIYRGVDNEVFSATFS